VRNWFKGLLSGQAKPSALELLTGNPWLCDTCEQMHNGMFDVVCRAPDHWPLPIDFEPNSALCMDRDFLSVDFCVLGGEEFFVRCVYQLPVLGMSHALGFGVWSSLSRSNFELYVDSFDHFDQDKIGPMFGYFSSSLRGFADSLYEHCDVVPQAEGQRPILLLHNQEHELSKMQRDGITPERVLKIYADNGHRTS
jgi:hypothetical protein